MLSHMPKVFQGSTSKEGESQKLQDSHAKSNVILNLFLNNALANL